MILTAENLSFATDYMPPLIPESEILLPSYLFIDEGGWIAIDVPEGTETAVEQCQVLAESILYTKNRNATTPYFVVHRIEDDLDGEDPATYDISSIEILPRSLSFVPIFQYGMRAIYEDSELEGYNWEFEGFDSNETIQILDNKNITMGSEKMPIPALFPYPLSFKKYHKYSVTEYHRNEHQIRAELNNPFHNTQKSGKVVTWFILAGLLLTEGEESLVRRVTSIPIK